MKWDDLDFWKSKDWGTVQTKLVNLKDKGILFNPRSEHMFAALDAVSFDEVRVMLLGQDPYPDPKFATGVAFEVPQAYVKNPPPSLKNIFREYHSDLSYEFPSEAWNLRKWTDQGVLLWNAVPTCQSWLPGSHSHWPEWKALTREIVMKLSDKGIIFVLLGNKSHYFSKYIDQDNNWVIQTSHPSPLGVTKGRSPFRGSRIFSTINGWLIGKKIDWRFEDVNAKGKGNRV